MITAEEIANELVDPRDPEDRLIITPRPDLEDLRKSGAASVDLRLGCWFLTYRPSRIGYHYTYRHMDSPAFKADVEEPDEAREEQDEVEEVARARREVAQLRRELAEARKELDKAKKQNESEKPNEARLAKQHYVRIGEGFYLHPKAFVLAATLEWIRLPSDRGAYVIGRSSWGRHGLIIATATGVHPGFTGCLTLELSNAGEIPIKVKPGSTICQIFIHEVKKTKKSRFLDRSTFVGRRKPAIVPIELDETAERLIGGPRRRH